MKTPDFLIIGAMKCGTSSLQTQLAAQPGVFMTTPKEPNFFSDDPVFAKGMGWYGALYDAAAPGDLTGEASTHYTKRPTWPDTVQRLHAAVPDARLIYMIRNPVERCVSHYIHDWSEGRIAHDLDTAIDRIPEIIDYVLSGFLEPRKHGSAIGFEIMQQRFLEQGFLVPERCVKSRFRHARGFGEIVHGRAGVSVLPECGHHGLQGILGLYFPWPSTCHLALSLLPCSRLIATTDQSGSCTRPPTYAYTLHNLKVDHDNFAKE